MIVKPIGIENVVNWQDNGIFADTQKPVTDDNYTLAGDVNQDNLYVGYMKEHGLKGKLSLPVLSSLGAITGRQTIGDCEVYKHVNGTTIIKGAVINPNLPDSRISLGFSADENGLQYYNNPNDPMPIKTRNMAGLQKWEETDDYIIYVDKDAVMTTVQNYVAGTYDLFLERKANIDGAIELLRENGIEWTAEDDSKLLQDINLSQLERVANTPTTMDEPTEIQTFEARTVPTTYECCFRVDKKTGEIYIGEGYENYVKIDNISTLRDVETISHIKSENKTTAKVRALDLTSGRIDRTFEIQIGVIITEENKFLSFSKIESCDNTSILGSWGSIVGGDKSIATSQNELKEFNIHSVKVEAAQNMRSNIIFRTASDKLVPGDEWTIEVSKIQLTKTSTPKPFVKSVMPSGKLSFVTDATSETHSFVVKERLCSNDNWGFATKKEVLLVDLGVDSDALLSNLYTNCMLNFQAGNVYDGFCLNIWKRPVRGHSSFKQLLIYKGNLTESELKAENEKEINVGVYYHQENSVPLTYGIDSMKAMRVYSPALTDTEIAEEVNKNIYIPENRDGVPNYLGEAK